MSSFNQLKLKVSLVTLFVSTGIFAIAMFLSNSIFGALYGSPRMILIMLPAELIVITLCSLVVKRFFSWTEVGFNTPLRKQVLWLTPVYLILAVGWIILLLNLPKLEITSEQWKNFWLIGLVTMTVGITEELLFRGIILSSLSERMSTRKAILLSALFFSLFHSINVISGLPLSALLVQMVSAFIAGFYLASVKVKINSIIPLIIWHWFWDFLTLGCDLFGFKTPQLISSIILLELITGLIIWIRLNKPVSGSN